jgi:hypothetical protein
MKQASNNCASVYVFENTIVRLDFGFRNAVLNMGVVISPKLYFMSAELDGVTFQNTLI